MDSPVKAAAIIAGGASRRMGQNKALLSLNGVPLVLRVARVLAPLFSQLVVVTADADISRTANLPSIPDIHPGKGPLGGIHAALRHFQAPVFCVACDLPFLSGEAIEFLCAQLKSHDAALPQIGKQAQPLHAVYAQSCLPVFEKELQGERARRMERVLSPLDVHFIQEDAWRRFDASLKIFTNLNTPEEARTAGFSL